MKELIEKELVFKIMGFAMEVHNELGHGLREKTYERALCREFGLQGVAHDQQLVYPVFYKRRLMTTSPIWLSNSGLL